MSIEKQKLYNVIDTLNAPENLIIKDKEDLRKKLEEGIKDTDNGRVCSIHEAFDEIESMLSRRE